MSQAGGVLRHFVLAVVSLCLGAAALAVAVAALSVGTSSILALLVPSVFCLGPCVPSLLVGLVVVCVYLSTH